MVDRTVVPRRTVLELAGVAVTPSVAGCGRHDEDAELESGNPESADVTDERGPPPGWSGVEEIALETSVAIWTGVDPEPIADVENPTLVCVAGREYVITWEAADQFTHNLELRNDDDEVVDDYATETLETIGETATLRFEASQEVSEYVCAPHESSMRGDVEIVEGGRV